MCAWQKANDLNKFLFELVVQFYRGLKPRRPRFRFSYQLLYYRYSR